MNKIKTLLAVAGLLAGGLFTGCVTGGGASVRRDVYETNGVHTVERGRLLPYMAFGDAAQTIASERIANTKTGNSIGLKGLDQETSATNIAPIIGSAGELIGKAAKAFVAP